MPYVVTTKRRHRASAFEVEHYESVSRRAVATLEEGVRWILDRCSGDFTYAVVPHANVMCATLDGVSGETTSAELASAHRLA